ncbi:MAG: hypothetical protein Kow00121_52100 [Elainellaceae cyanobacterium]
MNNQTDESATRRIPCIFVLEPDDQVRPLLKHNLETWGYQTIVALDEADAIQRSRGGCEPFDLILLNQDSKSIDELMAIGRQIRQSTELDSRAPIIVMAERYGVDLEGQDIQVGDNEYVTYLEDGQQLKVILQRLCPVY